MRFSKRPETRGHCIFLPHQLEDNAQMAAKQEIVRHVDDVKSVVGVESAQRVQHLNFNE